MRLAVTGASGFVGGAVCRAAVARGWQVHAFGRRHAVAAAHVGTAPYRSWDIASGPLPDPPAIDAVVHCAGSVTDWGPAPVQWTANVTGTGHVLSSFQPPVRFVHISTASVYDPYRPSVRVTEDQAPVTRYLNAYAASKAAAEQLVHVKRPDAVVLRPHAIYGPGDTTLLPRLLSAIRGSRLFGVGDGQQLMHLTSLANLVDACLLAAAATGAGGVYNIADAEPLTLDDALTALLAARRLDVQVTYLPRRLVWPLAGVVEGAYWLTRRRRSPRLTRYVVSHLAYERTLDLTAARTRLGYRPTATSFEGALDW